MAVEQIPQIDLEEILREKLPGRTLPKFVIRYLKKIVHVDEVNYVLSSFSDTKNFEFLKHLLGYMRIDYILEGAENLPKENGKRYIFASNHPLGGLDGIVLAYALGTQYEEKMRLLTNDVLLFLDPLKELFIPVNKVGTQGKENAEKLNAFYESDNNLITFPSGKCSRKTKGEVVDPEWKKNFIAKSTQHKRDIVPVYFEGRNSKFFYNLANFRTSVGIKANLEMLYLADEFFKQKGASFKVKIGKPIPWETFDKSKTQAQWAEWVKEISYSMR